MHIIANFYSSVNWIGHRGKIVDKVDEYLMEISRVKHFPGSEIWSLDVPSQSVLTLPFNAVVLGFFWCRQLAPGPLGEPLAATSKQFEPKLSQGLYIQLE